MYVTEEWVYWSDESSHNLNAEGGMYPRVIRSKFSPVFTKLFYCYYQPKPREFFMSLLAINRPRRRHSVLGCPRVRLCVIIH